MIRLAGLATCLLAFGVMTSGCGDAEQGELGIAVDLVQLPGTNAFAGVSFIRVKVEADGQAVGPNKYYLYNEAGGSVSLDGIPFGEGRQVVVEGWSGTPDGEGEYLVSRGRSSPVTVNPGAESTGVNVLIAPVNQFHSMTSFLDSNVQSLAQGRIGHTVTKTARGEVLVIGGGAIESAESAWWKPEGFTSFSKSVEVINEANQHISLHPKGMYFGRAWHTATALSTGQVFLAGGYTSLNDQNQPLKRVEVYNPGLANTIDVIKYDMQVPRWGHTATLIEENSFTVLFVGGDDEGSAQGTYEIWNPYSGTIAFGQLPDNRMRRHHQATLFDVPDRGPAVLISGGESSTGPLDSLLIYDIKNNSMFVHSGTLAAPRTQHSSTWVKGRNFLYLAGGYTSLDRKQVSNAIDVYDITSDTISPQPGFNLNVARGGHSAVRAYGNSVVFTGGTGQGGSVLDSMEIVYEDRDSAQGAFVIKVLESTNEGPKIVPFLPQARTGARSVFTDSGMVLTLGGAGTVGELSTDLLLFNPF